ncbi:hypothetical protein DUNSADRAFT_12656 [Dunaliella salina]|uniref:Encoded protein n=1 Tax=Dunaliella salina TaxID=3046 RepID=A0ABQ7H3R1_DUNSA|nr:hypothetical protein DUNSADRAFT_12656 [Dunaliella salina]|eukprot:KAF5841491.1 hypothetical protein DUNSADRAFT_12656 [Dunaliella salina]
MLLAHVHTASSVKISGNPASPHPAERFRTEILCWCIRCKRFRVEILFSPGAVGDPFQVAAERSRAASLSTKLSKELAQGGNPAAEQQQQGAGAGSDIPDKTGSGEEWPNGSTKYSTATPREAHTGAPGAKGAGNKGGKKEGEKEDKSEDGKAGSRASMEGPPPQPQPQQQQQQQQFEYVSVSRLNSTSGSVKLKSKPSSNVDEGEVASGRFGRLSNCSAGKGGNREEPGGAEIESSKPSQQPSASISPKVKSKFIERAISNWCNMKPIKPKAPCHATNDLFPIGSKNGCRMQLAMCPVDMEKISFLKQHWQCGVGRTLPWDVQCPEDVKCCEDVCRAA